MPYGHASQSPWQQADAPTTITLSVTLLQVVVYDVSTQERLWCTQPGHTETIFDCAFAPGPHLNMLATCSFDGTVRVWDSASYTCIKTLDTKAPGREEPVAVKGTLVGQLVKQGTAGVSVTSLAVQLLAAAVSCRAGMPRLHLLTSSWLASLTVSFSG